MRSEKFSKNIYLAETILYSNEELPEETPEILKVLEEEMEDLGSKIEFYGGFKNFYKALTRESLESVLDADLLKDEISDRSKLKIFDEIHDKLKFSILSGRLIYVNFILYMLEAKLGGQLGKNN